MEGCAFPVRTYFGMLGLNNAPTRKEKKVATQMSKPVANQQEIETTINAHVMRVVSVSMSFVEMDALVNILEKVYDLNPVEKAIVRDFTRAVESVR